MAAKARKDGKGAKAGKTSPRFGTPEWRKAHPPKKAKASKAKAKAKK